MPREHPGHSNSTRDDFTHRHHQMVSTESRLIILHQYSVQFSHSVVSDSLQPHGLQYTRLPCPITNSWIILHLCSQRWGSSIQLAKISPEADCGSDHELLIAKYRLKLKNAGKTTRPFRYDVNQIP